MTVISFFIRTPINLGTRRQRLRVNFKDSNMASNHVWATFVPRSGTARGGTCGLWSKVTGTRSFPETLQALSSSIRTSRGQQGNLQNCYRCSESINQGGLSSLPPRAQTLVLLLYSTIFIYPSRNTHFQMPGDRNPKSAPDPTFYAANGSSGLAQTAGMKNQSWHHPRH